MAGSTPKKAKAAFLTEAASLLLPRMVDELLTKITSFGWSVNIDSTYGTPRGVGRYRTMQHCARRFRPRMVQQTNGDKPLPSASELTHCHTKGDRARGHYAFKGELSVTDAELATVELA
jgi:hypothetical protein